MRSGFTLIEISIVLVVIGLVAGSVIVGKDLIRTAHARAQLTQIEKYQTAVTTFRGKYGYLPGDMPDPAATQFGFYHRGNFGGMGDNNGLIEGIHCATDGCAGGGLLGAGETGVFWRDLSDAKLIDNSFSMALSDSIDAPPMVIDDYWPQARVGLGNYVYVWSVNDMNYFAVSALWVSPESGTPNTAPRFPVWSASYIDGKIDDGLPESGRVLAGYMSLWTSGGYGSGSPSWAGRGGSFGYPDPYVDADNPDEFNCMDLHAGTGYMTYAVQISGGDYSACALSFQFQ